MNKYKRQTILNEVGESGQKKLLSIKVLIVGCGGLGGEVAVHLAAAGIGEIHLLDFDIIDETNLHRQVFYQEKDIEKSKVETLKNYISKQNSTIKVLVHQDKLTKTNIEKYIANVDYVFDCTDDLHTKYLVNDACVLNQKTLIYGSLHKFEGHVAVFNALDENNERSSNLRDLFPEIPRENIPSCSEVGTLNAVVSIIANIQVNELYKLILEIGKPLFNQLLVFNSLDNEILKLKHQKNPEIDIQKTWNNSNYDSTDSCNNELEITFDELLKGDYKVISLIAETNLNVFLYTILQEIEAKKVKLEKGKYCIVCQKGISSLKAVKILREQFLESEFYSLRGGIFNF